MAINSFNFGGQNADPEIVRENFNKIARYLTNADSCVLSLQSQSANISALGANVAIRNFTVFMRSDTGACDVTIPDPVIFALSVIGKKDTIFFFKGLSGAFTKTININSGTVEGATSLSLANDQTICIQSDGTEYKILFDTTSMIGGSGDFVESVTGYNVDNTDPVNPVILPVEVDGITITGSGTPGDPFIAMVSGSGDTGSDLTADSGVYIDIDVIKLGGNPLTADTLIDVTDAFSLTVAGDVPVATAAGALIAINNSATGVAIQATADAGTAIRGDANAGTGVIGASTGTGGIGVHGSGIGSSGQGVWGEATAGTGVRGSSVDGLAGYFQVAPASTSTVVSIFNFVRTTTGTPADGIGQSVDFLMGGGSVKLISKTIDVTSGDQTVEFSITGTGSGVDNILAVFSGNKDVTLPGRLGIGVAPSHLMEIQSPLDGSVYLLNIDSAGFQAGLTAFDGTHTSAMLLNGGATPSFDLFESNGANINGSSNTIFMAADNYIIHGNTLGDNIITISADALITFTQGLFDYANDAAAAAGTPVIPLFTLYRTGSTVKIRVS